MPSRWRWSVLLFLALAAPLGAQVIYVDADAPGANDGTSWENAYHDLQSALDVAGEGMTVKVANGTYLPSKLLFKDKPLSFSFRIPDGVNLQGGFVGSGFADPDERVLSPSATILSGDRGIPGDKSDNCWTVVSALNTADNTTLDGFTVRDGNNPFSLTDGAGMQVMDGSAVIRNCWFTDNRADWGGGGIYFDGIALTLQSCNFTQNSVPQYGGGGGLYANGIASVFDCEFSSNGANFGGAIAASGLLNVERTRFTGGFAMQVGGAIQCTGSAVLKGCTFSQCGAGGNAGPGPGGASGNGGALNVGGTLQAEACDFEECVAWGFAFYYSFPAEGGAVWCGGPSASFTRCRFLRNEAHGSTSTGARGGALYLDTANALLERCELIENIGHTGFYFGTPSRGGAIYSKDSTLTLVRCRLLDNEAESITTFPETMGEGGGIYGNCVVQDSVLWGNVADPLAIEASQLTGGTAVVNFSVIEGWTGMLGGRGNSGMLPGGLLPDGAEARKHAESRGQ